MVDSTTPLRPTSSVDHLSDAVQGVKQYARQETVEPLKGAARWVVVGTVGAFSLGLAVVFLALGVLRVVQDAGGSALTGGWSFVPYLATVLVLCCVVAAVFSRISRRSLRKGG